MSTKLAKEEKNQFLTYLQDLSSYSRQEAFDFIQYLAIREKHTQSSPITSQEVEKLFKQTHSLPGSKRITEKTIQAEIERHRNGQ